MTDAPDDAPASAPAPDAPDEAGAAGEAADPDEAASTAEVSDASAPRPPFASEWPHDAELDRLLAYLARGNHAAVREGADTLAAKTENPKVAAAARELRRRLEPDPIGRVLLGTTFVLLMVLTLWAMRRSRELHAVPPLPGPQVQIVK